MIYEIGPMEYFSVETVVKVSNSSTFIVDLTLGVVLVALLFKHGFGIKVLLPSTNDFPKPNGVGLRTEGCIFYGVPVDVEWRDND